MDAHRAVTPDAAPALSALGVLAFVLTYVVGFFATAGAAGVDFGTNSRDGNDVRMGGLVGIALAIVFTAGLCALIVAGAYGSASTTEQAVAAGKAAGGFILNPVNLIPVILGPTAFKWMAFLLAVAAFPSACFSAFIAANSFKTTLPKVNPFVSVGIGAAVSIILAVTGLAGRCRPRLRDHRRLLRPDLRRHVRRLPDEPGDVDGPARRLQPGGLDRLGGGLRRRDPPQPRRGRPGGAGARLRGGGPRLLVVRQGRALVAGRAAPQGGDRQGLGQTRTGWGDIEALPPRGLAGPPRRLDPEEPRAMSSPNTLSASVRARLSAMMFLQFFVWGAWWVTMGTYLLQGLKFTGTETAQAYSTIPWGAIVAPFVIGMVADRFFAAEKVLGVLHLAGAALLYAVSTVTDPTAFFWVLLVYALCYVPTLALVNAISFNQMASPEKEFPAVRVFGTLGWIAAGLDRGAPGHRGPGRTAAGGRRGVRAPRRLCLLPAPHPAEVPGARGEGP